MKTPRPLTANLLQVLDALDLEWIGQHALYDKLGFAALVGNRLHYLEGRGLVEKRERAGQSPEWRRTPTEIL